MKSLKAVGVAVFALALTGCESWSIITSSKIEPSATDAEYSAVVPVNSNETWATLFGKDEIAMKYREKCVKEDEQQLASLAGAALITAVGGAAWDLGVMAVNDKVGKIQERSSSTWNATWTTSSDVLKRTQCLALVRYRNTTQTKGEQTKVVPAPQMVLLLKLAEFDPKKDKLTAVQFVPMLAASKTSAALTKDEGQGLGKIGLSAAGAISYYVDGELKESTPDAISVSGVTVGEAENNPSLMVKSLGSGESNATKPVTYPFDITVDKGEEDSKKPSKSTPLYVKFAVVETGTLSGKDAKAKAEIKVITDALGPVVKDLIKKRFEDDDLE
ncbi:hypothetical protein ACI77O_12915 [Pseudomonas tritici]|uniref:hypothetical protein n=1 Tax=Pseudomonas tritici TaxID=2745518 RepID=UPI00387B0456